MSKLHQDPRPLGACHSWARTPATLISGQAHIDGADVIATAMELKWGAGRLRLLVSPELREKFDRQRYLFNQAIQHGDLEAVRLQSARMTAAWQALDKAATAAGAEVLSPEVWEVSLDDGTVAVLVQSQEEARAVVARRASQERAGEPEARQVAVYTLEELAKILNAWRTFNEVKITFPGATVEAVRRPSDPLDQLLDTAVDLDDPLDDLFQYGV